MIGMVVGRRMGDHDRGPETTEELDNHHSRFCRIDQFPIRKTPLEKLRAKQGCGSLHFTAANLAEIFDRRIGLTLFASTEHGDPDGRTVSAGSGKRTCAQQFGVVRMGDDGQVAFG